MGNYIQALAERISLVASPNTWIEGEALVQLKTVAQLEAMQAVVGLPDIHPGRGYPVGTAFFSTHKVYPALVGGDIGCGMQLWQTDQALRTLKISRMEKQLKSIEGPLSKEERLQLKPTSTLRVPGTIGGGNHFAEFQQTDTVYDEQVFESLGFNQDKVLLLVHSGSRGRGGQILDEHLREFGHQGLPTEGEAFHNYMDRHNHALDYAKENRELIALRLLKKLKASGTCVLDLWHNAVMPVTIGGVAGWLHRKGAAPADQGVVVIPGSRGAYSYLVEPIQGAPYEQALHSIAHGAGRKWRRSECKGRLEDKYNLDQLKRSSFDSRLICKQPELIYEEAPQAYKSIDTVIEALEGAGLVHKIARLQPLLTYKTAKELW